MSVSQRRLIRFVISGGLASLTFLVGSYLLLKLGWRPWVANSTAYAIAFALGYCLQRGWTFDARHDHGRALPRYFVVQVACAALTALAGELSGTVLHLAPIVTSVGSTLVSGVASYIASSRWVFPIRHSEEA